MNAHPTAQNTGIELDARSGDGIDVQLLWHATDDSITVVVRDVSNDATFELTVARDEALDAFHHPYAYAAYQGVEFDVPHRAHDEAHATHA